MKYLLTTTAAFALMASTANAQVLDGWSGEASASASTTTGNTETTDVGLGLALDKAADIWTHQFRLSYDYGSSSGTDNKNRVFGSYQLNRDFGEKAFAYGTGSWMVDDFGPFKYEQFLGIGAGYRVIETDTPTLWSLEGGPGYRRQKSRASLMVAEEFAVRGASRFSHALNESVTLSNDTEILWSDSDTYVWNDTNLTAQVAGNLSARFGFRVDYHTDPGFGLEKTDTITRGALVYSIN